MSRRILVILGHPDKASFCGALADTYAAGAQEGGHQVTQVALGDLAFDPVLRHGYGKAQPLEPDLMALRQHLLDHDHWVFVLPNWWGGWPALFKGFVDRVFLPGFAFATEPGRSGHQKLLAGHSAHVVMTMDAPLWWDRLVYRDAALRQLSVCTLAFSGAGPVRATRFGRVKHSTPTQRGQWLARVHTLGIKGH